MRTTCFVDPHFTVFLPEFPYLLGGNLLEFDYLAYVQEGDVVYPVAVEDTSDGVEPMSKTPRYISYIRRLIPVVFARGSSKPEGVALATAASSSALGEFFDVPPEDYRRRVGELYVYFPDNGHINYFILTSSPEFLRELAEDLEKSADALIDAYPFLGRYLKAKALAMLGKCPLHYYASVLAESEVGCFPNAVKVPQDDAVALAMHLREEIAALAFGLLLYGLAGGPVEVWDGGGAEKLTKLGHTVASARYWHNKEDRLKRWLILRDFEKEILDRLVDKIREKYGNVCVVFIPTYMVVYDGQHAPTSRYSLPPKSSVEEVLERLRKDSSKDYDKDDYAKVDVLWHNLGEGYLSVSDKGGPPYLFEI